eukprot:2266799-Pyramimonas_sp.AAC.1
MKDKEPDVWGQDLKDRVEAALSLGSGQPSKEGDGSGPSGAAGPDASASPAAVKPKKKARKS